MDSQERCRELCRRLKTRHSRFDFEWLWAITATLEGCEMAVNDLHAIIKELEEKLEERNQKEWVEKE